MEIADNYLKYRKHKPEYPIWRQKRSEDEAKRLAYIEKNGIDDKERKNDIKRAKAVLNAVDIMDEYSQTRAEDMETSLQAINQSVAEVLAYTGYGIGFLALKFSKTLKNFSTKIAGGDKFLGMTLVASFCAISLTCLGNVLFSIWGAKKEVEASRLGRTEAMQKSLNSPNQFAVLTEEQEKERDEIAQNIEMSEKDSKNVVNATAGFGILKSLKILLGKNEELKKAREDFKKEIEKDEANFDAELSAQEIEEAKKDKQLITNIVEKIDIASQDYAENIELATTALNTLAVAGGGISGLVTNNLIKLSKNLSKYKNIVSLAVGGFIALGFAVVAAKVQKQGSRVARFKVKEDFLKNPEKLLYVDDEKAKNEDGSKFIKEEKRPGFFKFLLKVVRDNKEYNEYLKNENKKIQKQRKAQEEIKLTPQQEKRAHQLQKNVFKMFNKLDDKSQMYSESTEALGEILQAAASLFTAAMILIGTGKLTSDKFIQKTNEMFDKVEASGRGAVKATIKAFAPIFKNLFLTIIPLIGLNIVITKEQKGASRVANMLAINEMDDFRNFADYSGKALKKDSPEEKKSKEIFPSPPWAMRTHQG